VRWRAVLVWIALLCALGSLPAFGHATLVSSEPTDGAVIAASPPALALIFNEPVSALVLRLIGPDGQGRLLPKSEGRHERVEILLAAALAQGTHALSWRVVSLDGHPVGGTVVFSVGEPSSAAPGLQAASDPAVAAILWLAKAVIYIGLFVGIGGSFFAAWIARRPAVRSSLASALAAGLLATVVAVGLQGLDALGLPASNLTDPIVWRTGLDTSFGTTAIVGACALAVSLLGIALPLAARAASLLGIVGTGIALALSGHASAAAPQIVMRPAVFMHAIAVAFWAGALAPLASMLRVPQGTAALVRFSRSIPWAVLAIVCSGIVLAVVQVQQPSALVMTAYGRVLSAKLALVVLLLALAAWNRYRVTPAILAKLAGARRALRRTIIAEIIIVACIFGLVASWRFTPPPRVLAIAAAQPALLHIHTAQAMADIRFEPGRAGIVRASVVIMTGDFGGLDAKEVQLTIENKAAGVEAIARPAIKGGDAVWRVEQLPIPQGGRWDVRLDILIDDFRKIILEGAIDLDGS
jgi:copper transport protein